MAKPCACSTVGASVWEVEHMGRLNTRMGSKERGASMSPYLSDQAPISGPEQSLIVLLLLLPQGVYLGRPEQRGALHLTEGGGCGARGPLVSVALGDGARSDEVPKLPVHVVGLGFMSGPTPH